MHQLWLSKNDLMPLPGLKAGIRPERFPYLLNVSPLSPIKEPSDIIVPS